LLLDLRQATFAASIHVASLFALAFILCVGVEMPDGKTPSPVDIHVGERIRMRRIMIHMSQQTLAGRLGLTFQQIQKYEKGTNRIGASRLHEISEILGMPVAFLFEDLPGQKSRASEQMPKYFVEFMGTAQGRRLVDAFTKLSDKDVRSNLVRLVESIAGTPPAHHPSYLE
jgi:transcriptional regulator with XRE-family HTH domain